MYKVPTYAQIKINSKTYVRDYNNKYLWTIYNVFSINILT